MSFSRFYPTDDSWLLVTIGISWFLPYPLKFISGYLYVVVCMTLRHILGNYIFLIWLPLSSIVINKSGWSEHSLETTSKPLSPEKILYLGGIFVSKFFFRFILCHITYTHTHIHSPTVTDIHTFYTHFTITIHEVFKENSAKDNCFQLLLYVI